MKKIGPVLSLFLSLITIFQGCDNGDHFSTTNSKEKVDSLLSVLTSRINDTASAHAVFAKAAVMSQSLNYSEGLALAYDKFGVVLRNLSYYPEALSYHKKALEIAELANSPKIEIQTLNNIGVVYRRMDDNDLAIDYHMKALKLSDRINDIKNICIATNSMGNIYLTLKQYTTALQCFKRALSLELGRGNILGAAINYNNIGSVFESENQLDSALRYYNESLDLNLKIKDSNGEAICYNDIGGIYALKKDYSNATHYFTKALKIHKAGGDKIYISSSYTRIANTLYLQKKYSEAIEYYQKGLKIALQIGSKGQAEESFRGLSKCYQSTGLFEKALSAYKTAVDYSDSIMNEANVSHITRIQAQYDTEKKQQQIELLKKEKQTSQLILLIVSILTIGIAVIFLYIYRSIRQKRKISQQELELKEQKIRELEKDRQIIASHAVLQGEEAERSRLARDLHDGLGGLLSGVKLALSGVKGNYVVSDKGAEQFEKAICLLDNSIHELRRVAHNMMPVALVKFGLREAIQDFCDQFHEGKPKIHFQFFGDHARLDQSFEVSVYRIAQELINNSIKHARANIVRVELIQDDKRIYLTVQDDGIGIDLKKLDSIKGTGITNIRSRTESLNGRFELYSKTGKGTEASVEFYH